MIPTNMENVRLMVVEEQEIYREIYKNTLPTRGGIEVCRICEVDETGTCRIFNRFPRLNLLTLSFQPSHSSPDRRMYFITGGLLHKEHDELKPRFEFRDVLNGRYTIAAIHDFRPRLPWGFYSLTQAVIHLIAMRTFQKYMAKKRD